MNGKKTSITEERSWERNKESDMQVLFNKWDLTIGNEIYTA